MKLTIGTRKSKLALKQVDEIIELLNKYYPKNDYDIKPIDTYGDLERETYISDIEGTDFFTREIEQALISKDIDVAIHSAKDLPEKLHPDLYIAAITKGVDNRDVLVLKNKLNKIQINDLPAGTKIGTSSNRRKKQIKQINPNVDIVDIRGNIEERLELIDNNIVDGIVIALTGLIRLNLTHRISSILDFDTPFLQGKLAVEIRKDNHKLVDLFQKIDYRSQLGKIYLTGSGPGSVEYLTQKAKSIIENADIILYDYHIDKLILKINKAAKKIPVGKKKGYNFKNQRQINRMLLNYAETGQNIVRLKIGDPFIFGRGGEEMDLLKRNYIPYEIVPGITAATAAGAIAGVPLTKRDISSSVSFCTGFPSHKIQYPDTDTIVYYMSGRTIDIIADKLIQKGWDKDTPVTMVSRIGMGDEKIYRSNLDNIRTDKPLLKTPVITIITKNTSKPVPDYYYNRVLVTGTNIDIYKFNGEIVHQPLIELVPLKNYRYADNIIKNIQRFTMIIFTSKHAVLYFFQRIRKLNIDIRNLKHIKFVSIGKTTDKTLNKYNIYSDIIPENNCSGGLIDELKKQRITGEHILIPRSNKSRNYLPQQLKKLNNDVNTITIYRNVLPKHISKVKLSDIDSIVFSSPSSVKNFIKIYDRIPNNKEIFVTGHITYKEVKKYVLRQKISYFTRS